MDPSRAVQSESLSSKSDVPKRQKMENSPLSEDNDLRPLPVDFVQPELVSTKITTFPVSQTRLESLRAENQTLRQEAFDILRRIKKSEAVVSKMETVFTKGQLKRLRNHLKKSNWNYEEIAQSLTLFTASPLMYQMLWRRKFPFPSPSTLRKWAATLKLRPGILTSTMRVLAGDDFEEKDRLCVLAFYEIRLRKTTNADEPDGSGLLPYKYVQFFIVRSLVGKWKHIIYYNFDCMLPGLVAKDIVRALREINFTVVALVTGVGPRKMSLWRELQIDEQHPFFEVFDDEKVFVFANVPHVMKRLRNEFIKRGFVVNGKCITVEPLEEMLAVEPSALWVSHDLTSKHISPKVIGQHSIQVVSQLFSQSVADSIRKCVAMGKMYTANAIECSDFIQLVDEWFGLFNLSSDDQQSPLYGQAMAEQNAVIVLMSDVMKSLKVVDSEEEIQPFQRGILLNNTSLPLLHGFLRDRYNLSCVITNNLNADDMEHSFGIRKSHGGFASRPTPLEFKNRLRAGIFANLSVTSL